MLVSFPSHPPALTPDTRTPFTHTHTLPSPPLSPHTGSAWCIYPSYDYSHAIIDSLENIDYSLCTLEFEVRRDLYYWVLEQLDIWRPHVWEFARLNITHVQLSKRKILKLVNTGKVRGWDDPRIPTINGLRRRGYTAEAINAFCRDIGVSRNDNVIEFSKLEFHIREFHLPPSGSSSARTERGCVCGVCKCGCPLP